MYTQRSDELLRLCDELIYLQSEVGYLAFQLTKYGHFATIEHHTIDETLLNFISRLAQLEDRIRTAHTHLQSEANLPVVIQIQQQLSKYYPAPNTNGDLINREPILRVMSHFLHLAIEAASILKNITKSGANDENPVDNNERSSESPAENQGSTFLRLCNWSFLIFERDSWRNYGLALKDDHDIFGDGIDVLKRYAIQAKFNEPIAKVIDLIVNNNDEVAKSLKGYERALYSITKRHGDHGIHIDVLILRIYSMRGKEKKPPGRASVQRMCRRVSTKIMEHRCQVRYDEKAEKVFFECF